MPRSRESNREYMREYRARKRREAGAVSSGVGRAAPAAAVAAPVSRGTAAGPHRRAVTRLLRATGLLHVPEEAPLVELLKELATVMDEGGGVKAAAQYRAALRDVRAVLAFSARPKSSADVVPPSVEEEAASEGSPPARVNSLAAFRDARGIGA